DSARIWDAASGELLHTVRHFATVQDARLSPDGRWLVTAGPRSVGVWDASTGQPLLTLTGPTDIVTGAWFDADGRTIEATSLDGPLRRYTCALCGSRQQVVAAAEARLAALAR